MTSENLIKEIEHYRAELIAIMSRFKRTSENYWIHSKDDPRFRTYVIEIIDLLNDTIGNNQYSPLINKIFNEGISTFLESPSYKSVEDIVSVLDSIITRLKRNPELCEPKKEIVAPIEQKQIEYPDKITVKWLYTHVPVRLWAYLLSLLLTAFILGTAFASTQLYKSFIALITPNTNITTNNKINTK